MIRALLALIALGITLGVGADTRVFAQDTPAVFVHGLRSSGDTWAGAAARLEQRLAISSHRPTLPSFEPYETQAAALQGQLGWLPPNAVAIGHSNGGIVSRQWSHHRPLGGLLTIGTPHAGAPLIYNLNSIIGFFYHGMNLTGAAFGAFAPGGEWWDVLVYATAALNFANDVSWTSLTDLAVTVGYRNGVMGSVIGQMSPGSSFLNGLNSGGSLWHEANAVPHRAGIVNVADRYWLGGPVRAFLPELADSAGTYIQVAAAVLDTAGLYILTTAGPGNVQATQKAYTLMNVAGWLRQVDWQWCLAVSSPGMTYCEANDGLVPRSSQFYPAAHNIESSGPAHVQETDRSDEVLHYGLSALLGVRTRGSGGGPGPDPGPGGADTMIGGRRLYPWDYVDSSDGRYRLIYQGDGNLVLYGPTGPVWATMTIESPGWAEMQVDGNLVVYNGAQTPTWAAGTPGNDGAYLRVQTNGAIVIYRADRYPLWWSQ